MIKDAFESCDICDGQNVVTFSFWDQWSIWIINNVTRIKDVQSDIYYTTIDN